MDYILWEKWKEIPDIMDLTFIQYNILRFLRNALNQECGIDYGIGINWTSNKQRATSKESCIILVTVLNMCIK